MNLMSHHGHVASPSLNPQDVHPVGDALDHHDYDQKGEVSHLNSTRFSD